MGEGGVNTIIGEEFTADNLISGVNYTFKVAAVNKHGLGPFSEVIIITTHGGICMLLLSIGRGASDNSASLLTT